MRSADRSFVAIMLLILGFNVWYDFLYAQIWLVIDGVIVVIVGMVFLKYLFTRKVGSTPVLESSPFNFRRAFIWLGRLVLGVIFVYAGFSKLLMPNTHLWPLFVLRFSISMNISVFADQVASYKMISHEASQMVAHILPFVEIALGLLLLIGWRLRVWATAITVIMAGFLGVVTRAYLLHMDINCGCFGVPERLTGMTVIRDSLFTALALLMTVFAFLEARQPHPWSAPEKASA